MTPGTNPLGVLSGQEELRISIEAKDIAMLSAGVFLAMLLALIISKNL